MLNISEHDDIIVDGEFSSFKSVYDPHFSRHWYRWLGILIIILFLSLFLPWTQNINGSGKLTALNPSQKPQTVETAIAGRIDQWFVREGDFVKKGDTICHLVEIKDNYWDPELLKRTETQVKSKSSSVLAYTEKAKAAERQKRFLSEGMALKMEQVKNKIAQTELKIVSDSNDVVVAKVDKDVAKLRLDRQLELFNQGLSSLTDLESRKIKVQETDAKLISAQNKFLATKADLTNAKIEYNNLVNDYGDKISKSESDQLSALSDRYEAEANVAKLENQLTNYSIRKDQYYVTAPQDGYVTQLMKKGVGETVKEGEAIITIMPAQVERALEIYIDPVDLPLVKIGDDVRIQFDGWPVFVFSGWPNASYGTFGGEIFAIDKVISENGKFRLLVIPDIDEKTVWPEQLRVGSGAVSWILLGDVPIWWELWRVFNGFPPDFYQPAEKEGHKKAKEKDAKK